MKITMEEWLSELEGLQNSSPQNGWTTMELAKVFNREHTWVRQKVIRPLLDSGRLGCGMRRGTTIDGRTCQQPIYFLKPSEVATDEKITEPVLQKKTKVLDVAMAVRGRGRRRVPNNRQWKTAAKALAR